MGDGHHTREPHVTSHPARISDSAGAVLHPHGGPAAAPTVTDARIICPRCRVGEIVEETASCPICGHSIADPEHSGDPIPATIEDTVRKELTRYFRVEELLGRGGMSIVYLAREHELNRRVAVKVLPLQLVMGPDAVERFKREAKVAASLEHPHIVPIHAVGTSPTFLWYSMKWIKGQSLQRLLATKERLDLAECLSIIEPVATALHHAHLKGIVHRDVKPANVLMDETGWVTVCDFGVAKAFGSVPLTQTGLTLGTPGYMAPEQCYGRPLDGATDQYALAILVYECLTGSVPFTGDSLGEIIRKHCMDPPPRITEARPDLPASVADALIRAMDKEPTERFADVIEFVRALGGTPTPGGTAKPSIVHRTPQAEEVATTEGIAVGHEGSRRPRWELGVGLGVLLLIVGSAWLLLGGGLALQRQAAAPPAATPAAEDTTDTLGSRVSAEGAAPPPPAPVVEPGRLSVSSRPWGYVYVDGERVGETPRRNIEVAPGRHVLRIEQEGFRPYEQEFEIAAGEELRVTDVQLERVEGR